MKKIETNKENLLKDLESFYNPNKWHYITVNGIDFGDSLELQYYFTTYGEIQEAVCYFMRVNYEEEVPSIISLIPSVYLAEGEMVDMFGVKIKGVNKGTFLEPDSIQTPLRKNP